MKANFNDLKDNIIMSIDDYEIYVEKAIKFDIIVNDIKAKADAAGSEEDLANFNLIDDEMIMAVTGMNKYVRSVRNAIREEAGEQG